MVKDAKKAIKEKEKEDKEEESVQKDKKKYYGKNYKYYAVVKGRKPGIYTTWGECKKQVWKYKNSMFKGFYTMEEARKYTDPQSQNAIPQSPNPNPQSPIPKK